MGNRRTAKDNDKIKLLVNKWVKNKEYLKNDIGVEKLGKKLGVNRTYISNYINDIYQVNFNTWIHRMRIADAKQMIINNPDITMGQVSIMTGYADQAHFCKLFKLITGVSPMKWRKQVSDNGQNS